MSNQNDHAVTSPYAGRWVARLEGRIIAHGGTPEQARLAAQKSRYKEKLEIIYVPPAGSFSISPLVERVRAFLPNQEIYLVGGAVRDALLGKVSHDLDFALPSDAIETARHVANSLNADFYILHESFGAARVIVRSRPDDSEGAIAAALDRGPRDFLDFSSFRPAKTGSEQLFTLETDLRGRDFTINSMAYDLRTESILDPLNGASDLRARVIRASSPSAMEDDPIRILRGVRQAAALDFKIDPATRSAMKAAAARLPSVSPERQRDEIFKTLDGPRPDACMRAVEMLGVLPYLMPELTALKGVSQSAPHVADAWEHTLSVLQHLEGILGALETDYDAERNNDLFTGLLSLRLGRYRQQIAQHFAEPLNSDRSTRALLFLAALYHDVSKPGTRSTDETGRTHFLGHEIQGAARAAGRGRALRLSNDEIGRLETIIANHMRFHFHVSRMEAQSKLPSRKAIFRFFRDTGKAGVDLILLDTDSGIDNFKVHMGAVRRHTDFDRNLTPRSELNRVIENILKYPADLRSVIDHRQIAA